MPLWYKKPVFNASSAQISAAQLKAGCVRILCDLIFQEGWEMSKHESASENKWMVVLLFVGMLLLLLAVVSYVHAAETDGVLFDQFRNCLLIA